MKKLYCVRCDVEAKKGLLPTYEHEPGIVLRDVEAYICPKCKDYIFTEKQMEKIEKRTESIKVHTFAFERKFTISGRSLVLNIPEDIRRHMKISKGKKASIRPLDDKRFIVEIS